jgi:hypothetical protein
MTFFIVTAVKNLKSYIALTGWALKQRGSVSPVKYKLGSYIPEYDILLHSHHRETQILHEVSI